MFVFFLQLLECLVECYLVQKKFTEGKDLLNQVTDNLQVGDKEAMGCANLLMDKIDSA